MLRTLEEKIDPQHTAVIVIDVQNHFCHPEGGLAKRGTDISPILETVPRIAELIDAARAAGTLVVFVQLLHNEQNTSEARWEHWMRRGSVMGSEDLHCRPGTWGADFYVVSPREGEPVVVKHRYGGFIGTDLDMVLKSNGIQTIVITGFSSEACVESTARDGFMLDYYVVFVSDCTASARMDRHAVTLRNIEDNFGLVCASQDIRDIWAPVAVTVPSG
jgi:ureidoacrylate peracid hydrolase